MALRHWPTSGMQNGGHQTGSRNNVWTERDGDAISTAAPIFSTIPDLGMALPTRPDVDRHRKLICQPRNRKWKPEVEKRLNGNRWRSDSNGYLHIFDHAELIYGTADTARHRKLKCRPQNRSWKPEMEITYVPECRGRPLLGNIGYVMDYSGKAEKIWGIAVKIASTSLSVQKLFLRPV